MSRHCNGRLSGEGTWLDKVLAQFHQLLAGLVPGVEQGGLAFASSLKRSGQDPSRDLITGGGGPKHLTLLTILSLGSDGQVVEFLWVQGTHGREESVIRPIIGAVEKSQVQGQDGPEIMASPLRISSA